MALDWSENKERSTKNHVLLENNKIKVLMKAAKTVNNR